MVAIDKLTAMGNAVGLPGRFGVQWGFIQLRARLDALESAVMDDVANTRLDWDALAVAAALGECLSCGYAPCMCDQQ